MVKTVFDTSLSRSPFVAVRPTLQAAISIVRKAPQSYQSYATGTLSPLRVMPTEHYRRNLGDNTVLCKCGSVRRAGSLH